MHDASFDANQSDKYPGFQSLHDVSIYYLLKALESRVSDKLILSTNNT
jgi:hypothetical protein